MWIVQKRLYYQGSPWRMAGLMQSLNAPCICSEYQFLSIFSSLLLSLSWNVLCHYRIILLWFCRQCGIIHLCSFLLLFLYSRYTSICLLLCVTSLICQNVIVGFCCSLLGLDRFGVLRSVSNPVTDLSSISPKAFICTPSNWKSRATETVTTRPFKDSVTRTFNGFHIHIYPGEEKLANEIREMKNYNVNILGLIESRCTNLSKVRSEEMTRLYSGGSIKKNTVA